jgi:hypothetical protein
MHIDNQVGVFAFSKIKQCLGFRLPVSKKIIVLDIAPSISTIIVGSDPLPIS